MKSETVIFTTYFSNFFMYAAHQRGVASILYLTIVNELLLHLSAHLFAKFSNLPSTLFFPRSQPNGRKISKADTQWPFYFRLTKSSSGTIVN
jgi:hypothetical protein